MVIMHGTIDSRSNPSRIMHSHTFLQALHDKYVDQEEFDNKITLPKDNSISTEITLVGFDKVSGVQRQLKRLTSIDLSCRHIDSAGDLSSLGGFLDRVLILNLADNQLTWREIVKIITYLPNLREIILSGNRLNEEPIDNLPEIPDRKLVSLTLGRINSNWTTIANILPKIWNNIEQLDLWNSHLTIECMKLDQPYKFSTFIERLSALKLSYNNLPSFSWITDFGPTCNLVELDVSHCRLDHIEFDDSILNCLGNLQVLNISNNNVDSWSCVSTLNYLPNLKTLICHENPLFITQKLAKTMTVARIARIEYLNREEISKAFRRDSEIFYLRQIFHEYKLSLENRDDDFKSRHPRFDELAKTYGLPEDLNAKHTIDKYITVDICFGDTQITKKLPCDMRISNLHMLCKRLFKMRPSTSIQIICEEADSAIRYPLDLEGQTLHFFSVTNKHKLRVKTD